MCGIMGYVGERSCADIVFNGLKRLEYRGYDSAGVAVLNENKKIEIAKAEGKLKALEPMIKGLSPKAHLGIGHTRWATHGPPVTRNAHPHVAGDVALVHNGIIENYQDLKAGLSAAGVEFSSDTDTEVVLHLFRGELNHTETVRDAIMSLIQKLRGAFSLGIMVAQEPGALYLVKQGSPLVVGLGKNENFFGSDAAALVEHTNRAIFLEDGEFARISKDKVELWNFDGEVVERAPKTLEWAADSVEKQGYAHYMLKEINEQPAVMRRAINRLFDLETGAFNFVEMGLDKLDLSLIHI